MSQICLKGYQYAFQYLKCNVYVYIMFIQFKRIYVASQRRKKNKIQMIWDKEIIISALKEHHHWNVSWMTVFPTISLLAQTAILHYNMRKISVVTYIPESLKIFKTYCSNTVFVELWTIVPCTNSRLHSWLFLFIFSNLKKSPLEDISDTLYDNKGTYHISYKYSNKKA